MRGLLIVYLMFTTSAFLCAGIRSWRRENTRGGLEGFFVVALGAVLALAAILGVI